MGEAGQQLNAIRNGRFLYDGGFVNQPLDTIAEAKLYAGLQDLSREIKRQEKRKDKPFSYSELSEFEMELLTMVENGN